MRTSEKRPVLQAGGVVRKSVVLLLWAGGLMVADTALGRGASPYLPLNLSPDIERQVERAMILAGKPVMRRPLPAAVVLDALPQVCAVDESLCATVRQYLARYTTSSGVTQLSTELAVTSGESDQPIPNAHGMAVDGSWRLAAGAYYQPNDYVIASVGAVAYDGQATPTGTQLSAGFDWAQVDIGFRDHWYSPSADGSFLIGTQAPTLPSVTVSNYRPLSRLNATYEMFLAKMERSDRIRYPGGFTSGHPNLLGMQLAVAPGAGFGLAVNRLMQYGGGARGQAGLRGLLNAFLKNDAAQTLDTATSINEFGNQVASITASYIHPGRLPFETYFEYAGEDNLYSAGYRLGKIVLALGVDFPSLGDRYDLDYQVSERQDSWYNNHLYLDGLTNKGHVIGHWFGDERLLGDGPGGYTQSLSVGRRSDSGDYWRLQYRNSVNWRFATYPYRHAHEAALRFATQMFHHGAAAELNLGRDVFGQSFARLSGSIDFAGSGSASVPSTSSAGHDTDGEMFVDIGANRSHVHKIYWDGLPDELTADKQGVHAGFGARRHVTARSDLGVRLEFDRVDRHDLLSIRAVDYRLRVGKSLAAGAFFGAARYQIGLPAWGYYWGGGIQYRDILPRWDLGLDIRHYEKISRNNLLSTDRGYGISTVSFRDIGGGSIYLSRRF